MHGELGMTGKNPATRRYSFVSVSSNNDQSVVTERRECQDTRYLAIVPSEGTP